MRIEIFKGVTPQSSEGISLGKRPYVSPQIEVMEEELEEGFMAGSVRGEGEHTVIDPEQGGGGEDGEFTENGAKSTFGLDRSWGAEDFEEEY